MNRININRSLYWYTFLVLFLVSITDLHACGTTHSFPEIKTAWLLNEDRSPSHLFIGFISLTSAPYSLPMYVFDTKTSTYIGMYLKKQSAPNKLICPHCLKEYVYFKTFSNHIDEKHRPAVPDLELLQLLQPSNEN